MAPKKRKKIEEIDISMKGDKFHLFRLKQFFQYLVENDAEIKIYDNDDGYPLRYKAKNKRGELGLKKLVAEVFGIKNDSARKLVNGPLTLSQFITSTDKLHDLGTILDNITISVGGLQDTKDEQLSYRDLNFAYGEFKSWQKPYSRILKMYGIESEPMYTPGDLVDNGDILKRVLLEKSEEFRNGKGRQADLTSCHPALYDVMKEFLEYLSRAESSDAEKIYSEYERLLHIYFSKIENFDSRDGFLPDYEDLSIIFHSRTRSNCLEEYGKYVEQYRNHPEYSEVLKAVEFRYEFIGLFTTSDFNIKKWSHLEQALLLFCNHELQAVDEIILELVNKFIKRCRFTVHTSNKNNDSKTNITDIDIDKLAEIIMYYQVNMPLNKLFRVETNSILSTPLKMHADNYAAEHYFSEREINHAIKKALFMDLKIRVIKNLRGDLSKLFYPGEPKGQEYNGF